MDVGGMAWMWMCRWNGVDVGGLKLEVQLEGLRKVLSILEGREDQPQMSHPLKTWRAKVFQDASSEKDSEKACETRRNQKPDGKKKVKIQVVEENLSWLRRCAVGKTKNLEFLWELEEKLIIMNILPTSIYSMGALKVMLRFPNEVEMNQSLEENNKKQLQDLFVEIEPWREEFVIQSRSVWINITGIPYQAWETSNFEKVANLFGKFVTVDPDSMNGTCLENSRVLIETENFQMIREEVEVDPGNKIFKVFIWEESLQVSTTGYSPNQEFSNLPEPGEASGNDSDVQPGEVKLGCTEPQINASAGVDYSNLVRKAVTNPISGIPGEDPGTSTGVQSENEVLGCTEPQICASEGVEDSNLFCKADSNPFSGNDVQKEIQQKKVFVYHRRSKIRCRTAEARFSGIKVDAFLDSQIKF